jgi:hypothetical protein
MTAQRKKIFAEIQAVNDEIDQLLKKGEHATPRVRDLFTRRRDLQQQWLAIVETHLQQDGNSARKRASTRSPRTAIKR